MDNRNRTFVGLVLLLLGGLVLLMQPGALTLPPQDISEAAETATVQPSPTMTIILEEPTRQVDLTYGPNLIAERGGFEEFTASAAQISPDLASQDAEPDGSHVHPVGWREWYRDKNYDDTKSQAPFREGADPDQLPEWYPQGRNPPDLLLGRPEFTAARALSTADDQRRVFSGEYAAQFFCFFRTCEGGYYTRIVVPPNTERCKAAVQFQASVGTNTDLTNPDAYLTVFPTLEVRSAPPLRTGVTYHQQTFWVTAADGEEHFYDQWQRLEIEFDLPFDVEQVVFVVGAQANFPSQNDMYFDAASFRCMQSLSDVNLLPTPTPRVPNNAADACRQRGVDVSDDDLILVLNEGIQILNVYQCPGASGELAGVLTQTDNPAVLRQYTPNGTDRWVYIYTIRSGEIIEGWVEQIENGVELASVE